MFRRRPPRGYYFFRPHMPFGPGMIKEMSQLVFLWTISEAKEGISGYELQKNYRVKQTNVYRVLKEMEEKGYVTFEETIIQGRAQKLYKITEKGKERLKELREEWTLRVAFLTDIAPPEGRMFPFGRKKRQDEFIARVKQCKTKEELLVYLDGLLGHFTRRKKRLESNIQRLDSIIQHATEIINKIKEMKGYDINEIEEIMNNFLKHS